MLIERIKPNIKRVDNAYQVPYQGVDEAYQAQYLKRVDEAHQARYEELGGRAPGTAPTPEEMDVVVCAARWAPPAHGWGDKIGRQAGTGRQSSRWARAGTSRQARTGRHGQAGMGRVGAATQARQQTAGSAAGTRGGLRARAVAGAARGFVLPWSSPHVARPARGSSVQSTWPTSADERAS